MLSTSFATTPTVISLVLKFASVASSAKISANAFSIAVFVSALSVTNSFTILSTVATVSFTLMLASLTSLTKVSAPSKVSTCPTTFVILVEIFVPNTPSALRTARTLSTSLPIVPTLMSFVLKFARVASSAKISANAFSIAVFVSALSVTNSFTILSTVATVSFTLMLASLTSLTKVSAPSKVST